MMFNENYFQRRDEQEVPSALLALFVSANNGNEVQRGCFLKDVQQGLCSTRMMLNKDGVQRD